MPDTSPAPRIAVAVHGRFHGFELASELHSRGALCRLYTTYPTPVMRRFVPQALQLSTAPALELWRRFHRKTGLGPSPKIRLERAFARFVARRLPEAEACDVLVGWSGATLEAIEAAKRRGLKVVIERGSAHIEHQRDILAEESELTGIPFPPLDPRIVDRELAEYAAADAVAVPCDFAAGTFTKRSIPADRLIVNPYGVNIQAFAPPEVPRPRREKPRLLFVGRVGQRKGLVWLLRAFAPLAHRAELHLVGPHDGEAQTILDREPTDGVVVRGPLPASSLPDEYRRGDVFVLPSIEEGLALVLLQAMASGLPVVATPNTGAETLITHGKQGMIVPARDPQALTDALATLFDDHELREAMGTAAAARAREGFSWNDYGQRAYTAYQKLLTAA